MNSNIDLENIILPEYAYVNSYMFVISCGFVDSATPNEIGQKSNVTGSKTLQ